MESCAGIVELKQEKRRQLENLIKYKVKADSNELRSSHLAQYVINVQGNNPIKDIITYHLKLNP